MKNSKEQELIEIDLSAHPVQVGANLSMSLMPLIGDVMGKAEIVSFDEKIAFWAGFISTITGAMSGDIGYLATETVMEDAALRVVNLQSCVAPDPQGRTH